MIVTSNKPFSAWGEIFGDHMAATAMIDRLIHHAEILSLKGDSYRLTDRHLPPPPPAHTGPPHHPRRDPLSQGLHLPPHGPRPRPPAGRPTRRNTVTDHPRPSR